MASWTREEIPDLSGRTVVITGANAGLGLAVTEAVLTAGATVVMGCRSLQRGRAARDALGFSPDTQRPGTPARADIAELDLASIASVRAFAERFHRSYDRLDLLVNNAGVMAVRPEATELGVETQWAVNHLGHFALTGLLLPALIEHRSRIVTVSSLAAAGGDLDDHDPADLERHSRFQSYANSKLANQVFAVELHHRLREAGSTAASLVAHPGVAHTDLARSIGLGPLTPAVLAASRFLAQPAADGALPILRAATDPAAEGGQYYGPGGRRQWRGPAKQILLTPRATGRAAGRRLWRQSIETTGVRYLDDEPGA